MTPRAIVPTPVEEVPPGESAAIASMMAMLTQQLTKHYAPGETRRDAHPKNLGMVSASFTVDEACPQELRHGLFRESRTFSASIRFSNGHPKVDHDLKTDIRGMAIKISGVAGPTLLDTPPETSDAHDFLLATGEAFFGKDAVDFVDFPRASDEGTPAVIWWFIRGFRVRGAWQIARGRKTPASPLGLEYFSQLPYRLGPHVVKYAARPRRWRPPRLTPWYMIFGIRHVISVLTNVPALGKRLPGWDALRDALVRDLAGRSVTFDFFVQRWPDPGHLPVWAIENATRRWTAPWTKVATIEIHRQTADAISGRDKDAERLAFTPWRVREEHQPLGSISRARLAIYREMAAFRRARNGPRSP